MFGLFKRISFQRLFSLGQLFKTIDVAKTEQVDGSAHQRISYFAKFMRVV
jgi:hypothetical protein